MKIKLPKTYSQNDPAWKNQPLGTNGSIGQYGCLVTCAAMAATYFGHEETPASLNDFLTRNNGYANGNLYVWNAVAKKYTDMIYQGIVKTPEALTAPQMDTVRGIIDQKFPVFVKIDVLPTTSKLDEHWVLAVDYDGDDFIIQDPWDGAKKRITSWGVAPQKLIYAYAYYSGHPAIFQDEAHDDGELAHLKNEYTLQMKEVLKLQFEYSNLQAQYDFLNQEFIKLKKQTAPIKETTVEHNESDTKYKELEIMLKEFQNKLLNNNASGKSFWQSKKVLVGMSSNVLSFALILFQTAQIKPGDDWQSASIKLLGAALAAFGISNVASQYVKAQGVVDAAAVEGSG